MKRIIITIISSIHIMQGANMPRRANPEIIPAAQGLKATSSRSADNETVSSRNSKPEFPGDTVNQGPVSIKIKQENLQKMKILVAPVGSNDFFTELIPQLTRYLEGFGQKRAGFQVTVWPSEEVQHKNDIKKWFDKGYQLIIYMSCAHNELTWRIYDTSKANMILGKKAKITQASHQQIIDYVSAELWKTLTGQEAIFHSKIAFCKQHSQKKSVLRDIYITSPCHYNPELLVKGGKPLAPRWNKDETNPLLLYSEITTKNIRLMSVNTHKKRKIVSNWDGMNAWPSFANNGKKVVYCLSKSGNSQLYCHEYDDITKKILVSQITHNSGNNISPTLRDNGDIIFCSDFETKSPQIYYYHAHTKELERLTTDGYCASPSFCELNRTIAYCKPVNGIMQLFSYNLTTKQHKQLTYDEGSKDESSWSPEGQYIAYSVDFESKSRIALLNIGTGESFFITPESDYCAYPAWSPAQVVLSENLSVV